MEQLIVQAAVHDGIFGHLDRSKMQKGLYQYCKHTDSNEPRKRLTGCSKRRVVNSGKQRHLFVTDTKANLYQNFMLKVSSRCQKEEWKAHLVVTAGEETLNHGRISLMQY